MPKDNGAMSDKPSGVSAGAADGRRPPRWNIVARIRALCRAHVQFQTELAERLDILGQEISGVRRDFSVLSQEISTQSHCLSTLTQDSSTQAQALAALSQIVSTLGEDLSAQSEGVSALRSEQSTQSEGVSVLRNDFSTHSEGVTTLTAELSGLSQTVSALAQDLAAVSSLVAQSDTEQRQELAALVRAKDRLEGAVSQNSKAVSSDYDKIANAQSNIGNSVEQMRIRLNELTEQLEAVQAKLLHQRSSAK